MDNMFQDEFIDSPVFGESKILTDAGENVLKLLMSTSPVAVFQALNRALNEKDLCISVSELLI